ncbi:hypothetical protein N9023_05485 [Opitutaceae bacterium]|nr:hypothetical protein [Opitutaceae bacterium]MDB4474441.1 hypothetical protein [Opitutaceae bacterium]
MKLLTPAITALGSILLVGCNSNSPLTIEEHGATLAQNIGTPPSELTYISNGDFAPLDELAEGFNPQTKGVVALTESSLFWRDGQDENAETNSFDEIPFEIITGAALADGVLQLRIDGRLQVLRLTEWNPFQPSPQKTQEFLHILRGQDIPSFEVFATVPKFPVERLPFSHDDPTFMGYVQVTDGDGNTTYKWTVIPGDGNPPR